MRISRWIGVASAAAVMTCGMVTALPTAGAGTASVEGIPHLDHVFTIVLENENLGATWNTPGTYLNDLRSKGVFANQYYGTSHVSADNYIAMTSGQMPTPLFNADCPDWSKCVQFEQARPDGGVSVADQLDASHKSWKAYMDGMGAPCKHPTPDPTVASFQSDPYQSGYATRHNPFVYYPPVLSSATYCEQHVVDYSQLGADLRAESTTPNYVFISPDTCHDGHDSPCTGADVGTPGWAAGGLASANAWMSTQVGKILASPSFTTPGVSSVLFITTDEAANTDLTGCATGPLTTGGTPGTCASGIPPAGIDGGGLVGLLAIGSSAAQVGRPGATTSTPYDHASLLRTIEDGLGLGSLSPASATALLFEDSSGHLNQAASPLEHSMAALFASASG